MRSGIRAIHCPTTYRQWAMELLQRRPVAFGHWAVQRLQGPVSLLWGNGQGSSSNALPHYMGAVGTAILAMHHLTALGH